MGAEMLCYERDVSKGSLIIVRKENHSTPELAKGQLWQLSHAYIRIVELGKRLIHYKMMTQPSEPGVRTQISARDTLLGYLKSRRARLVEEN